MMVCSWLTLFASLFVLECAYPLQVGPTVFMNIDHRMFVLQERIVKGQLAVNDRRYIEWWPNPVGVFKNCSYFQSGSYAGYTPVMRMTMGTVVDWFRPVAGKSFCSMMLTCNQHEWSSSMSGPWVRPAYYEKCGYEGRLTQFNGNMGQLGGSARNWPYYNIPGDYREYLPFWGASHNGDPAKMKGGCCSSTKLTRDGWGQKFRLDVWGVVAPQLPEAAIAVLHAAIASAAAPSDPNYHLSSSSPVEWSVGSSSSFYSPTYYALLPIAIRGSPGLKVLTAGLYRISATITVERTDSLSTIRSDLHITLSVNNGIETYPGGWGGYTRYDSVVKHTRSSVHGEWLLDLEANDQLKIEISRHASGGSIRTWDDGRGIGASNFLVEKLDIPFTNVLVAGNKTTPQAIRLSAPAIDVNINIPVDTPTTIVWEVDSLGAAVDARTSVVYSALTSVVTADCVAGRCYSSVRVNVIGLYKICATVSFTSSSGPSHRTVYISINNVVVKTSSRSTYIRNLDGQDSASAHLCIVKALVSTDRIRVLTSAPAEGADSDYGTGVKLIDGESLLMIERLNKPTTHTSGAQSEPQVLFATAPTAPYVSSGDMAPLIVNDPYGVIIPWRTLASAAFVNSTSFKLNAAARRATVTPEPVTTPSAAPVPAAPVSANTGYNQVIVLGDGWYRIMVNIVARCLTCAAAGARASYEARIVVNNVKLPDTASEGYIRGDFNHVSSSVFLQTIVKLNYGDSVSVMTFKSAVSTQDVTLVDDESVLLVERLDPLTNLVP